VYDRENSGLLEDAVRNTAVDARGHKWIATDGGGLAVYREGGVDLHLATQ
jgi:hypothetical protein